MKKILISLAVVGLLLGVGVIIAVMNAQNIVTLIQPELEKQASKLVGSKVKIGQVQLSLFPSLHLTAPDISFAADSDELSVGKLALDFDWIPMLWGQANAEIEIVNPKLSLEKVETGIVVAGLNKKTASAPPKSQPQATTPVETSKTVEQKSADEISALPLNLKRVVIRDGDITLSGFIPGSGQKLHLEQVNLAAGIKIQPTLITVEDVDINIQEKLLGPISAKMKTLQLIPQTKTTSWTDLAISALESNLYLDGGITESNISISTGSKSSIKIETLLKATKLLPNLEKTVLPFNLGGFIDPQIKANMNFGSTIPAIDGAIGLRAINAQLSPRRIKELNATLKFSTEDEVQHFGIEKASLEVEDPTALLKPLLANLLIKNGTISPSQDVKISQWEVSFLDNALSGNASFTHNSELSISIDAANSKIIIEPLKGYVKALGAHAVSGILVPTAQLVAKTTKGTFQGSGSLRIEEGSYKLPNLDILKTSGSIDYSVTHQGATASSKNTSLEVNTLPLNLTFNAKSSKAFTHFNLEDFNITGLDKGLQGSATFTLPGSFSFKSTADSIGTPELLKLGKMEWLATSSGHLSQVNAQVSGELGSQLFPSLIGDFNSDGDQIKIIGFNLVGEILRKLNDLALISGGLTRAAPDTMSSYSQARDTEIKRFRIRSTLGDSSFNLDEFTLYGDVFALMGNGKVALPSNALAIKARFEFTKEFSQLLASSVKEIDRITNSEGKLVFPVSISGTPPALVVTPDFSELAKLGAQKALKKGAEKLLDKALGGKSGSDVVKKLFKF
jgi:hypothetical protein